MRISSAALLLLAACGEPAPEAAAPAESNPAKVAAANDHILCARGRDALAPTCTAEQEQGESGLIVTVRQADGGFHRLRVTRDGRGVVAADGAVPARVTIVDDTRIEVAVGDARYRLPAAVRPAR